MRGDRKRKKTMYKRGHIAQKKGEINTEADPHIPHSKSNHVKYHRFDYEQFKAISDSDQDIIRVVDVEGCALDQIKLLRHGLFDHINSFSHYLHTSFYHQYLF